MMPSGYLIHQPASHSVMSENFTTYLRKFISVLFENILIYCQKLEEYMKHLDIVLPILHEKTSAKKSKDGVGMQKIMHL